MRYFNEFLIFLRKQASSALFGGCLLFFILLTRYVTVPGIHRYDFLFIVAILVQLVLILGKYEKLREVGVIIVFHICAMGMEIYKTSPAVGSWTYPEPALLAIGTVPLFTGFMYSAVGSYMARAWRINNFVFKNLPKRSILLLFGVAIYVNFFTNFFTYDVRYILFALLVIVFWNTKFYATVTTKTYQIHPLLANALVALVIWGAEQFSTFARVWVYPNQTEIWRPVSFHMLTSWYMLLVFSFIIISLIYTTPKDHR